MSDTSTGYSKSGYAKSLGISTGELESRAKAAGFSTTEDYANSQGYSSGGYASASAVPSSLDYAQSLEAPISDALNNIVMAQRAQATPLETYNQLETSAGLPQQRQTAANLRDAIGNLEDTIKRVEPNVAATTRESFVTQGQRAGMVSAQQKPLNEQLSTMSTSLGRVTEGITASEANVNNLVSLVMQGNTQALEPLKLQYSALVDRSARLSSAFNTDSENKLNIYLANVKRGQDLSDQDRNEAFTLLQQEDTYKKSLTASAASAGVVLSGNETTAQILSMIGQAAADKIAYDRSQKNTSINIPGLTTVTSGSGWRVVSNASGQTGLQSYVTKQ